MQPLKLSPSAHRLAINLEKTSVNSSAADGLVHVADIGSTFYFAYEQLRNVAENREHHLLLRSAIERYLARYIKIHDFQPFGHDLVTELTHAGYLKNDSVSLKAVDAIDELMQQLISIIGAGVSRQAVPQKLITKWALQYASVKIEELINPDHRTAAFMQFAYEHYFTSVDRETTVGPDIPDQDYRIALYCAIQTEIFKSDQATTRFHCMQTSIDDLTPHNVGEFIALNKLLDEHYQGVLAGRLGRLINRYGAPMRILRELVFDGSGAATTMQNRGQLIGKVKAISTSEYERIHTQLGKRITRSIIFVIISKTIIGISIEVPYDIAVAGEIGLQALLINILFPPVYMATLGLRIRSPSARNTEVIANFVDRIVYQDAGAPVVYRPRRRRLSGELNVAFNMVYAVGFLGSMIGLAFGLRALGFNIVNATIFFVFFSAVSYLGLRLRRMAHELQLLDEHQSIFESVVDFLSVPFVAVGHWLSDKYSKANIVTILLDLAIEMPFKTMIRLARQWIKFLRDKQDEL